MAYAWHDFAGASMALAGRYNLSAEPMPAGRIRWRVWSGVGSWTVRQGVAETLSDAKSAAEAAHADATAYLLPPEEPRV